LRRADILFGAALAFLAGAGLWIAWARAGLPAGSFTAGLEGPGPDPVAWPRLVIVWTPTAQLLFLAAYVWLARVPGSPALRRCFVADQAVSLGFVLGLVGLLLALRGVPAWRAGVGAWFVLFVATKTSIFLRAVWSWLSETAPATSRATTAVFLGALLPYLLLGAHVTTAISATGDEPYYLLITHSLLHDGDWDLGNNFARREYLPFYWGRLNPDTSGVSVMADGRIQAKAFQGLQPVVLLPGYWAAGRMGAVATMAALSALALALAFRIALLFGTSARAAFLAWLGAAFSVPLLCFAVSPWPEMTGALCLTTAAFLLCREPRSGLGAGGAALCLALAAGAKSRLFVPAIPVILAWPRRVSARAILALAGVLVAAFVGIVAYDQVVQDSSLVRRGGAGGVREMLRWLVAWTIEAPSQYRGHLGLLLDQEFGLLASAPMFALALAGAVVSLRERRWLVALVTIGPFALAWYYLGAFVTTRGPQWHGGFSPPGRLLVATLPLLAVSAALTLDRLRGRMAWTVVAGLYVVTMGQALVVSLRPAWRFQEGVGRATMLAQLFTLTGMDPGRLLPSFITPGDVWVAPGAVILVGILVAGWLAAHRTGAAPPAGAWVGGVIGVGLLITMALVALGYYSRGSYPALLGAGEGGVPFLGVIPIDTGEGVAPRERLVWAAQRAAVVDLAPRLRAGRYEVRIVGGSQGEPSGPLLSVRLGGAAQPAQPMAGAVPPAWRERDYVFELPWSGGRLPIRIELSEVARDPPSRRAYVRAIEIRRLPPPP
jgi:hypothetical protein